METDKSALEEVLQTDPGRRSAANKLSRLLEAEGDMQGAWDCVAGARRYNPADSRLAARQLRLARHLFRLPEANQIVADFRAQIPHDPPLLRAAVDILNLQERAAEAEQLAAEAERAGPNPAEALALAMDCARRDGRCEDAYARYQAASHAHQTDPRCLVLLAELHETRGQNRRADDVATQAETALRGEDDQRQQPDARAVRWLRRARQLRDRVAAFDEAQRLIDDVRPACDAPKGLLLIVTHGSPQMTFFTALPARELKRRGYHVVFVTRAGLVPVTPLGVPEIDELEGLLTESGLSLDTSVTGRDIDVDSWDVDWDRRMVARDGVNVYQPIFETMCNRFRRFTVDGGSAGLESVRRHLIRKCDALLRVCEHVYARLARDDFPVRILAGAPHLVPNGAARIFCEEMGYQRNIHFITLMPSYEHYFEAGKRLAATRLSLHDHTQHAGRQRMPLFALPETLAQWYAKIDDEDAMAARVTQVATVPRSRATGEHAGFTTVQNAAARARAAGRPVVCVFGKILFDICEPEQGGPAHADIDDWLNDTLDAARNSDALFLVKPHPNERHKTFGRPSELFTDLIKTQLPENVLVCGHDWVNTGELPGLIDLAVVWAGTAALELGALDVPVLVCSTWGAKDHPVPFWTPSDRAHYHAMLATPGDLDWTPEARQQCIRTLAYMGSDEVMIPYPYADMPIGAQEDSQKCWDHRAVQRYLAQGDPYIDRIADRIEASLTRQEPSAT